MNCVLAIDQGTSSTRAMVFDVAGRVLGSAQCEFDQIFPHDGWVEHDPEVLWNTTLFAARGALANAGIEARALTGIGITNQRETYEDFNLCCLLPAQSHCERKTYS